MREKRNKYSGSGMLSGPYSYAFGNPTPISISQIMGYLKRKSTLIIFVRHANLKYEYGNRQFWCRRYYVDTVGLNEETIRKNVREQEKHDIAPDNLMVKEYEDPFKR